MTLGTALSAPGFLSGLSTGLPAGCALYPGKRAQPLAAGPFVLPVALLLAGLPEAAPGWGRRGRDTHGLRQGGAAPLGACFPASAGGAAAAEGTLSCGFRADPAEPSEGLRPKPA